MTQAFIENEFLEALDFEQRLPCETSHQPCDEPAKWFWTKYCCNRTYALCQTHTQILWDFFAEHDEYHCGDCRANDFEWETVPL